MIYNQEVIDKIRDHLIEKKLSIAVAESVTSGHLQAAFSTAVDASKFFQGGITAYNIGQKCRHLLVEPTHVLKCNCVSERVSEDIAKNVSKLFLSDYGIGITGYAAALPEKNIHELFAFFSISFQDRILLTKRINTDNNNSFEVQIFYVDETLKELEKILKQK